MPKMKSHSGAKKRFSTTSKGKLKAKQAFARHMMQNKSKKMKRNARGNTIMCAADTRIIFRSFLPYARKKKRVKLVKRETV